MKTKTIILIFLALMISNSSCFKEKLSWSEQCLKTDYNPNVLPKETQTGENRLGCLIDGKVFANSKCSPHYTFGWHAKPIEAQFKISSLGDPFWYFYIYGVSHETYKISITIWNLEFPQIGDTLIIDILSYYGEKRYIDYEYGKICFTKIDTINRIISGKFEGNPRIGYEFVGKEYIAITDGRFDIKYN